MEALQSSFSLGEIAPGLYGRVDTQLYKAALASAHNVIIDIHGGVRRRPGLTAVRIGHVQPNALDTTFIPFVFSVRDSALWNITSRGVFETVEFIENVVRTGILHNLTTGIPDNQRVSYSQTADEVLVSSRSMQPVIIRRTLDAINRAELDDTLVEQIQDFGLPSAVASYQQRRVLAGSNNKPASLSFSKVGEPDNFTKGTPVTENDAVGATLVSRTIDQIIQLAQLKRMVIFTEGSEWEINGAVTPSQVNIDRLSGWGCSDIPVVEAEDFILFVPPDKRSIRALVTNQYDNLNSEDITLFANHIFKNRTIRSMAHLGRLLVVVFEDGTGALCTYDRQTQYPAWATMDTPAGRLFDVIAMPINGIWKFIFVVLPTVDATSFTLMEFDPTGALLYDQLYQVLPTDIEAGEVDLQRLRDRQGTFSVYDIAGNLKAKSDSTASCENFPLIPLPEEADLEGTHYIGMPFPAYIETLNVQEEVGAGPLMGRRVTIPRARVQVLNTRGLRMGPPGKLTSVRDRQFEGPGEQTKLFSGYIRQSLNTDWTQNGRLRIEASDAQPMHILSIIPDLDTGGQD